MGLKSLLLAIMLSIGLNVQSASFSVRVEADPAITQHPISRNALEDFKALLDSACHCLDGASRNTQLILQLNAPPAGGDTVRSVFAEGRSYPYFHYPAHDFKWNSNGTTLTLTAPSPHGIANGLYALLQERLGFKFVHARQTLIPDLDQWPISGDWEWTGRPRFDKKGFHLHTMHPLELTQPLHDPDFPDALAMIQEYILWLARNGQNYFEFSLMEDVDLDLERWVRHASRFTRYAHDRGILCGLDLSIHMVQQKAFKLVEFAPKDMRSYEKQIQERLRVLMQAEWDFINLEFALAEFVGGMEGLRNRLRDAVIAEMEQYPGTKLIGRQHVVKPEDEVGGSHGAESLNVPRDPRMGVLVHTVMCYALTDTHVPVYELENFSHLHQMLIDQNAVRETWYYPESAYWVTFDNSIPLLLFPYLNARWQDIQTCAALGIPGHVTFSSGWEWGYWLVDWSIARWSWEYSLRERAAMLPGTVEGPYQYLMEIFPQPKDAEIIRSIADMQLEWLIRRNLLRWLCPSNPTDELPSPMNKQFQPRGFANLGDLGDVVRKSPERLDELPKDSLIRFAHETLEALGNMDISFIRQPDGPLLLSLQQELMDGIWVTGLRARHSGLLMHAVADWKAAGKNKRPGPKSELRTGIAAAEDVREAATPIIRRQETRYRYPVSLLAERYHSFTAYDFGYLYPVHNLHFWEREEQQILKGRHGPFFMNIYALGKIAGLRD